MKSIFQLFYILCFSHSILAQNTTVTGTIKDKAYVPVPYVNVILIAKVNPETIFGTLTDENGNFSIEVPKQVYNFEVSVIGFPSTITSLDLASSKSKKNLGDIIINTEVSLDEVVVTSNDSNYKIELDKKVYNVSKDLSVSGGSLIDVMQNVPSVQVEVDGKMSIRGNGSVHILIDGRISGLTDTALLLRTIPAASIDKVEVITNPSSKYSAEGSGGIINIILKKGKKKRLSSSFEIFSGVRLNSGVNVNINKADENYSWYINSGLGYSEPKATGEIALSDFESFPSESFQNSEKILKQFYVLNNLGGEYKFNSKHSVTADFTYRLANLNTINSIAYEDYDNNSLYGTSERFDSEEFNNNFFQIASEYKLNLNERGSLLKLSALTQSSIEDGNSTIVEENTFPQVEIYANDAIDNDIDDKRFTVAIDYVHILKNKSQLEFGSRGRFTNIDNDYVGNRLEDDITTIIPEFSDETNYSENVTAFYGQYAKSFKKFKFQIGLRTETTNIDITSNNNTKKISRNYTNAFPSSFLNYQFNDDKSLRFSISRRIQRPRRYDIVPFSSFSDSRNIFVGNPEVNPSYVILTELAFESKFSNKFTLAPTLFFRRTNQDMDYFIQKENISINGNIEEVFVTRTVNIGTDNSYGLELGFIYKPINWFSIYNEVTLNGYEQRGSYETTNFDTNGFAFSGRLHLDFKVTNSFKFQFQNRFRGANNRGQLSRKALYRLDFGMSQNLLNDNASLSINIKDIFDSWEWNIKTRGENFKQNIKSQVRVPQLNVSFIYRWNQKRYQGKKGQQYDRL
ncbi:TonB-dependent receptor domain-containing protein [Maribacter polysaccharolyticus]|uniref:TonB-dependent receptor domain-containing protein n=1 Tax=Maribacter polysaccharolyticus TaxID=3020831 RepID=UPI00237F9F49|nr:TonB-dependent receptor [Maribacter polysaccharolyticus]MDE3741113.1 TonB-dependent receptor [Maribacter polysaccharolyticus]